jgi:hypothetical protein
MGGSDGQHESVPFGGSEGKWRNVRAPEICGVFIDASVFASAYATHTAVNRRGLKGDGNPRTAPSNRRCKSNARTL